MEWRCGRPDPGNSPRPPALLSWRVQWGSTMPCKLAKNAMRAAGLILACWMGANPLWAADDAPERWTYHLDPLPQPLVVSADAVGRVRRGGPAHAVVVASQPSPFVLTSSGDPQNPLVEHWDL